HASSVRGMCGGSLHSANEAAASVLRYDLLKLRCQNAVAEGFCFNEPSLHRGMPLGGQRWSRLCGMLYLAGYDQGCSPAATSSLGSVESGILTRLGEAAMSVAAGQRLVLRTDGASRGNPGHAAAGVVIEAQGGTLLARGKRYLGMMTNNQAEYRALTL